jgi:tol-pal system protein YbgF
MPGGPGSPPAMAGADDPETESFNAAYSDYSKGNYELAVMGFSDFLKTHASHPLASDAQYWIGECYFSQGKYKEASEAFDKTTKSWPTCEKAAPALLKKGLAQMELGQTSRAVPTFQKVVSEHPDSEEARIAAARLQQLGLRSP